MKSMRTAQITAFLLAAMILAGCSSVGPQEQTAAIAAQPSVAAPGGTTPAVIDPATKVAGAAEGQVVPGAQGAPVATTAAQAVPVAMAECEQLKIELAAFKSDGVPEKLAQFGQAKYTPTPDEQTRFSRYAAVNQATKAKCGTTTATPAKKKPKAEQSAAITKKPVAKKPTTAAKQVPAVAAAPAAATAAADPLTEPSTAGQPAAAAPLDGIVTTGG